MIVLFPSQHEDAAAGAGTDAAAGCQPHCTGSDRAQEKEESGLRWARIRSRGTAGHGAEVWRGGGEHLLE